MAGHLWGFLSYGSSGKGFMRSLAILAGKSNYLI